MQGHLGHINDKADQCYGLVTESHLVSHCQAVAPESRPEMLLELPEPLMGLSRAPHLVAVVPFPCARCLEQDWCPDGLHQVKVCKTVPAQEGRDEKGEGSQELVMSSRLSALCQPGEWGLSVSLFPVSAQSQPITTMALKIHWYSFPSRYWGVHPVTSPHVFLSNQPYKH